MTQDEHGCSPSKSTMRHTNGRPLIKAYQQVVMPYTVEKKRHLRFTRVFLVAVPAHHCHLGSPLHQDKEGMEANIVHASKAT